MNHPESNRKNILRAVLLLFLLGVLNSARIQAEWYGSLHINNTYDDNVFGISDPQQVFINSNSLFLGYMPDSSDFAASYNGSMNFITELPELQFHTHNITLSYGFQYGDSVDNNLDFYVSGAGRFNTEEYSYYNNTNISGGIISTHKWTQSLINLFGYELNLKSYSNNPDLSYTENSFYSGLKTYFETKTSFDLRVTYSIKSFSTDGSTQKLKGSGSGSSNSVGQLAGSVNIGQSIFDKTGLSFYYKQKFNISGESFLQKSAETDFFYESEIYDDPYSYESKESNIKLTQVLPDNYKIVLQGFYQWKNYSYLADNLIDYRHDEKSGFIISGQKSFMGSWLFFDNLSVKLNYYYINNDSNMGLFKHNSNTFSIGFGTNIL